MGVLVAVGVRVMVTYGVNKDVGPFSSVAKVAVALAQPDRDSPTTIITNNHFVGFISRIILCKMNLPASSGYATLIA